MMPTGLLWVRKPFRPRSGGCHGTWSIGPWRAQRGALSGGYLVDEVSWRSIFYINVPVGALAVLAAIWIYLPPGKQPGPAL